MSKVPKTHKTVRRDRLWKFLTKTHPLEDAQNKVFRNINRKYEQYTGNYEEENRDFEEGVNLRLVAPLQAKYEKLGVNVISVYMDSNDGTAVLLRELQAGRLKEDTVVVTFVPGHVFLMKWINPVNKYPRIKMEDGEPYKAQDPAWLIWDVNENYPYHDKLRRELENTALGWDGGPGMYNVQGDLDWGFDDVTDDLFNAFGYTTKINEQIDTFYRRAALRSMKETVCATHAAAMLYDMNGLINHEPLTAQAFYSFFNKALQSPSVYAMYNLQIETIIINDTEGTESWKPPRPLLPAEHNDSGVSLSKPGARNLKPTIRPTPGIDAP